MICGKVIYPNIRAAVDAIKGTMEWKKSIRSSIKTPSRAYFCDECQGYHLHTENKKQVVKKMKAQRTKSEVDSIEHKKQEFKRERQTLIIHDRLKFKIK